jgi:hypothetical protein
MQRSRNSGGNSSSISIRKAPLQRCATDTNEDEKAQIPTLSLESLRAIARIVRAIKSRLSRQADGPVDTRFATSPDGGSPATNCQDGSQSDESKNEQNQ